MNDFLKCVLHSINKKRKIITNFLEQFKKSKARKKYNSKTLLKCTRDIKKHGILWKYTIREWKTKLTNVPLNLQLTKKIFIINQKKRCLQWFIFKYISQKLASQIPKLSQIFERYISRVNVIMISKPLQTNKLKDAFFLLKKSKLRCWQCYFQHY